MKIRKSTVTMPFLFHFHNSLAQSKIVRELEYRVFPIYWFSMMISSSPCSLRKQIILFMLNHSSMSEIKSKPNKQTKRSIVAEPILQSIEDTDIQIHFWDLESNLSVIFLGYYLKYITIFMFSPQLELQMQVKWSLGEKTKWSKQENFCVLHFKLWEGASSKAKGK